MATHVPAWKRLGLKLKYAKEQPDTTLTAISTNVQDHDPDVSERPAKRRRIVKNNAGISPEQNGTHSSSDIATQIPRSRGANTTNGSPPLPETSAGSLNQPIQRKKSVTFSEETKQEDGDSRTTIDFPAGSPGSTPNRSRKLSKDEPPENPTTTTNNDTEPTATNHDTTPTKKQSKPQSGKKSKQSKVSTKDKSSSALDYLTLHRSTRDSWKFNKILDVWILNHALDVQAIPSTHVPSLAGYVRGLPAKAGSRDRLIKECRESLSSSQLDGDTIEEDRNLFIRFADSQDGALEDATRLGDFLESHSRAALLLWSLDETASGLGQGTSPSKSSTQQGTVPVKKKKSRTSAPIDISSSSESDSDSDSSDDSSESEGETKVNSDKIPRVAVNGSAGKDNTSPSGTSSSEDEDEDSTSSSGGSSDSSSDDDE